MRERHLLLGTRVCSHAAPHRPPLGLLWLRNPAGAPSSARAFFELPAPLGRCPCSAMTAAEGSQPGSRRGCRWWAGRTSGSSESGGALDGCPEAWGRGSGLGAHGLESLLAPDEPRESGLRRCRPVCVLSLGWTAGPFGEPFAGDAVFRAEFSQGPGSPSSGSCPTATYSRKQLFLRH